MRSFAGVIFLVSFSFAQFGNYSSELPLDTLAAVGKHIITANDFLERFELMPWPNKEQSSKIEFTKLGFLYSMVAEKLLALESSEMNIGGDSASLRLQRNLERMFVRDELYKQEVLPNITVSDVELREGILRYPYEVEAQVLGILTKNEGLLLRKKVLQSKNKSATFNYFNDSLFISLDTIQVRFGFGDKKIEDAVFSLGRDSISLPIETQAYGLIMLRLLRKTTQSENLRLSHADRIHKVENIIKRRKEDSLATKTFASVTSPQRAEANTEMFLLLADSVHSILTADSMSYRSNAVYKFPSSAINILERKFASDLSKQFVTIASGNMSLGDVLLGLSNNNVLFPSLNLDHIRAVLNNNIKTVIQSELLAREGLRKNLQQSKTVRRDVAVWMDSRKGWLVARSVIDSVHVTDDEIESEYQQHPQQYGATVMVQLREILVDSLNLGLEIRERMNKGEEFSSLAKKYSKRKEWASLGGQSQWIDAAKYGELGVFASSADIGKLKGPLMTKDGFTLFTVLGKKIVDDSIRTNFEKSKYIIKQKLLANKQQKTLDKYIGTLAKKYNVTVNETGLRKIKTTTTNMVTWRNIGFGGRIVAVPQMIPQTEWVNEWLQQQLLNQ